MRYVTGSAQWIVECEFTTSHFYGIIKITYGTSPISTNQEGGFIMSNENMNANNELATREQAMLATQM